MANHKRWTKNTVIEAAKIAGVAYEVHPEWEAINPYGTSAGWTGAQPAPVGVVWHHTACPSKSNSDAPSLNYCLRPGPFAGEARACNAVLDRTGKFHFIGAFAQYHAGLGGPLRMNGAWVPKDLGNRFLYGVEIEAASSDKVVPYQFGDMRGMTEDQFTAMSKWCAALADLLGWDISAFIRHKDWTNGDWGPNPRLDTYGRKADVALSLARIHRQIDEYRGKPAPAPVAPPPGPLKPPAPTPAPAPTPVIRVQDVQPGMRNASVLRLQKALSAEVGLDYSSAPGLFGPRTRAAWRKWENRMNVRPADGIPDLTTLRALGVKHGFDVTR